MYPSKGMMCKAVMGREDKQGGTSYGAADFYK